MVWAVAWVPPIIRPTGVGERLEATPRATGLLGQYVRPVWQKQKQCQQRKNQYLDETG